MGLTGAVRGRAWTTTTQPGPDPDRPRDLVDRNFTATRPNQLWMSDFTYVATWRGFVYVAFVIDVFARRTVGWRVSSSLATDVVVDALEQAIYDCCGEHVDGLVHHSDRGPGSICRCATPTASPTPASRRRSAAAGIPTTALAESLERVLGDESWPLMGSPSVSV
jgi:transposase InsO family protein